MFAHQRPHLTPADLVKILGRRWTMWLLPGMAGLLLAGAYLWLKPYPWMASQTLILRNEAVNNSQEGPGRFRQENEMKTTQETIVEVARSRSVAAEALRHLPPVKGRAWKTWPNEDDIANLQDAITVSPPKGAEFGKSEIFYLKIKDRDRARSVALTNAVCKQLEAKLGVVRGFKAQGLVNELSQNVKLAEAELQSLTVQLKALEQKVGGRDLADLRMLDQTSNGDSDLRRNLTQVEAELRDARNNRQAGLELMSALEAGLKDSYRSGRHAQPAAGVAARPAQTEGGPDRIATENRPDAGELHSQPPPGQNGPVGGGAGSPAVAQRTFRGRSRPASGATPGRQPHRHAGEATRRKQRPARRPGRVAGGVLQPVGGGPASEHAGREGPQGIWLRPAARKRPRRPAA